MSTQWRPIETAPMDGTQVILLTPDRSSFPAQYMPGFLDGDGNDCWGWVAMSDLHPDDWSDGVCWDVNEDGLPSQKPTSWMPLPPPPEGM